MMANKKVKKAKSASLAKIGKESIKLHKDEHGVMSNKKMKSKTKGM